jgi:hypothetical protein
VNPLPRASAAKSELSVVAFRRVLFGDDEFDGGLIQRPVVRVGEDDPNLVRSSGKTDQDQGLAAGVSPVPRCIIDNDVEVPDARRHIERVRAKHRHDPQILGAVLNKDQSRDNGSAKGGSTMIFAGGCGSAKGTTAAGPSISFAV